MCVTRVLICLVLMAPQSAWAQVKRATPTPAPACVAACAETCQHEQAADGCNPAVGLTSCRIKQDRCVAVCKRKCPPA